MESILSRFCLDGHVTDCHRHGCGHIHDTYFVQTDSGAQYILQKMNHNVFPRIDYVMENITAISDYLRHQGCGEREAVEVIHTTDGGSWLQDSEGGCWRVLGYIRDSLCLQNVERPEEFYESGVAYGTFQHRLCDFPAETLHETIPDFHNTPVRYQQLRDAAAEDRMGRVAAVQSELAGYLALEERVSRLHRQRAARELPTRVTHNDTKLNNVLLDVTTRKALCVIDLDTVMPGLAAYDFGDSIRFGASTAAEDETELSRVSLDLALYRVFAEGFLRSCPGLTDSEYESLPLGALTMTVECGSRFLADYIKGDVYFSIARPEHNLDRARTQLFLAQDMLKKWDAMCSIISEIRA